MHKLKTKQEKKVAQKIAIELAASALFLAKFPKGRKEKRIWNNGLIMGLKKGVISITEMIGDDDYTERIKKLIDWEGEIKKLFGAKRYKMLKEHERKMKEKQKDTA